MLFRKILPIIAILFIVALALSNYFNKTNEESIILANIIKYIFML
ncbi:hypothetical protein ACIQ1H_18675 [Lysinibacillus sp. NPDC097279]|nr:hypothetical protein [Lysinibacillus sp. CD3-6]